MKKNEKIKLTAYGVASLSIIVTGAVITYTLGNHNNESMRKVAKRELDSIACTSSVARYIDAKNKIDSLDYQIKNMMYDYRQVVEIERDSLQEIVDESPHKLINTYLKKRDALKSDDFNIGLFWDACASVLLAWMLEMCRQADKYNKKDYKKGG